MKISNRVKRALDIVGAIVGLLVLSPLVPVIALAILLDDGRPIFVYLARISGGKSIWVCKFRSMVRAAHLQKAALQSRNERNDGPFFKIKNDPRLTRTGRIIRKFRLDEYPQFWNVLTGDLSLVGPRPHEPEEVAQYPEEFRELPDARAGLTGLSQVSGASGLPFRRELELDRYYLAHQSLWFDCMILWKTVWIFLTDPTGV
ncbi:MAG: sugar transferase [bacterium]|nr:sugar transferase [bacterium]